MRIPWLAGAIVAGLVVAAAHRTAAAQEPELFRGKTVTIFIGAAAGSDQDLYGRLLTKYFGRHIPGNPALAAVNKPGTGGHAAAGYIYSASARDGTAIGLVPPEVLLAPLWFGFGRIPHDPTKFIYLGSAAGESTNCFVGADSGVDALRDAFVHEVAMGALTEGGPTRDGAVLLNALLGTKFRVVASYAGIGDILAAIAKGEVAGACGLTWTSVATRHPDWLLKGTLRGLVQESVTGSPLPTRLGIPLAGSFAASAQDREMLALAYAQQAFSEPLILPPETPPAAISALRKAFMATLEDPALLAEAKDHSLAIAPMPGAALAARIAGLYATPAPLVDRVRAILAAETAR